MAKALLGTAKRSIYLRLLLIFLITAVLLFVLVGGVASYLSDPERLIHNRIQSNIHQYASFLIEKLGSTPNQQKIDEMARELNLQIKINDPSSLKQSYNYDLPQKIFTHQHWIKHSDEMKMGHFRGYSYVVISRGVNEYIFAISHRQFTESKGIFLISLLLILVIVIAISYLLVKWLFKPLRGLNEGVKQVGEGNFEFRVENSRRDDLGELVDAFNQMSEKINFMMHEKEQLLLDVSHELRSPITRMKLALEFIENQKPKTNIQDDLLEMESMITELLESARLNNPNSSLSKENIVLNKFIEDLLGNYANVKPGLVFNSSKENVTLNADRDRLQICLRNIIDNAIKYSKNQEDPVRIELDRKDNNVIIHITDFGVGIPKQDQQHIFEPFYRVDKSRNSKTGGYGLGLSLCKKIANAHGGDISLTSIENEKTTFTLIFPN